MPDDDATDGRARRWAGQRARRREEFVEAAITAIGEIGPELSTAQIAARAGVARTRLYRYFDDGEDLQRAIAARVTELVLAELAPLWESRSSVLESFAAVTRGQLRWLTEHTNLYRYLATHSAPQTTSSGVLTDIRTAIGVHLAEKIAEYLRAAELDVRVAEPVAFALVGLVESAATRWLESPGGVSLEELSTDLTVWAWAVVDQATRSAGLTLDPHAIMPRPAELTAHSPRRGA